jgi:hypothetical protein
MSCIHVPIFETSVATHSIRKTGILNGDHAVELTESFKAFMFHHQNIIEICTV